MKLGHTRIYIYVYIMCIFVMYAMRAISRPYVKTGSSFHTSFAFSFYTFCIFVYRVRSSKRKINERNDDDVDDMKIEMELEEQDKVKDRPLHDFSRTHTHRQIYMSSCKPTLTFSYYLEYSIWMQSRKCEEKSQYTRLYNVFIYIDV